MPAPWPCHGLRGAPPLLHRVERATRSQPCPPLDGRPTAALPSGRVQLGVAAVLGHRHRAQQRGGAGAARDVELERALEPLRRLGGARREPVHLGVRLGERTVGRGEQPLLEHGQSQAAAAEAATRRAPAGRPTDEEGHVRVARVLELGCVGRARARATQRAHAAARLLRLEVAVVVAHVDVAVAPQLRDRARPPGEG